MGGWIKMEKDLLTDPRITNLISNAPALHGVTHALGCLAHLWMIADAHISNDDILALGADQIDQLLNVKGFCAVCPQDWLQVIDPHHVKLPGFHTHNGTIAKQKAQTAKRVAKHRKAGNANALQNGNGTALPDQTKTETLNPPKAPPKQGRRARTDGDTIPTDFALTPARRDFGESLGLQNVPRIFEDFCDYWLTKGGRSLDWQRTWYRWCRKQLDMPAQTKVNGHNTAAPANRDAAAWAEARAAAKAIGFREPFAMETPASYLTSIKLERDRPPKFSLSQLQARAQHR
jgi:hypothetical protein